MFMQPSLQKETVRWAIVLVAIPGDGEAEGDAAEDDGEGAGCAVVESTAASKAANTRLTRGVELCMRAMDGGCVCLLRRCEG
jgi:hypothetical protein